MYFQMLPVPTAGFEMLLSCKNLEATGSLFFRHKAFTADIILSQMLFAFLLTLAFKISLLSKLYYKNSLI